MQYIEIAILGIVQGITEFLPVSSSAHLIIVRNLLGIGQIISLNNLDFTFDIALHFGTLLAIVLVFFQDFWKIFTKGITKGTKDPDGKLLWLIAVATIPAAVAGLLFDDIVDSVFRKKYILIALALILMGIIIYFADKRSKSKKDIYDIGFKDALIIGFSQILALVPGFSRSGTTIATSRKLNINKEASTKFSFFLSTPIILGAVVLELIKGDLSLIIANYQMFLIGISISFLTGVLSIKFLLKYIKKNDFSIFMWYRLAVGLMIILRVIIKVL